MTSERETALSTAMETWCKKNFRVFSETQFNAILKFQACTEFFECLREIGFSKKSIGPYEEWREEYMFLWEEFQGWCVDAICGKL